MAYKVTFADMLYEWDRYWKMLKESIMFLYHHYSSIQKDSTEDWWVSLYFYYSQQVSVTCLGPSLVYYLLWSLVYPSVHCSIQFHSYPHLSSYSDHLLWEPTTTFGKTNFETPTLEHSGTGWPKDWSTISVNWHILVLEFYLLFHHPLSQPLSIQSLISKVFPLVILTKHICKRV